MFFSQSVLLYIAYCRSRAERKGLERQLLAEEIFNTLYKALHKKCLLFFFLFSSKTHWMSTWFLLISFNGYCFSASYSTFRIRNLRKLEFSSLSSAELRRQAIYST